MQVAYADDIRAHRLRREIVATVLANAMVNRGGPTFAIRMADQSGAGMADVARAWLVASDAFGLAGIESAIDALDARIPGALQLDLYARVQALIQDASLWMLRNAALTGDLDTLTQRFRQGLSAYRDWLAAQTLPPAVAADVEAFTAAGVPADLAARVAGLRLGLGALDVILVAETADRPIPIAALASAAVGETFRFETIDALARQLAPRDYYDGLALDRARRILADANRRIAIAVAAAGDDGLEAWLAPRRAEVERTMATISGLLQGEPTVARFTVAAGLLGDLAAG